MPLSPLSHLHAYKYGVAYAKRITQKGVFSRINWWKFIVNPEVEQL